MAGTGRLVLVVGPSGAGKDTLIAAAKTALVGDPHYVFPRRVVTREVVAELEDHESVNAEEFARRKALGAYVLSWDAHGLAYGLPVSLKDDIAAGRIVVVNGSRAMTKAAAAMFPRTTVLLIEAAPEVRARRLAGRGRESETEIAARLRREVPDAQPDAIHIDNSGALEEGTGRFLKALRVLAAD
jgi:phosphonate metabolism protein PhnN/1,5-bisphosphokinase (PRPP-forming)